MIRNNKEYDFWTSISPKHPVDIMVPPDKVDFFTRFMDCNNFNVSVFAENVEE